jgi:hypothetical protein
MTGRRSSAEAIGYSKQAVSDFVKRNDLSGAAEVSESGQIDENDEADENGLGRIRAEGAPPSMPSTSV